MNNIQKEIIDYWNNQPCNIKHGKSKFGTKEFFNEISERRYFVEPHIKNFANFSKYKNKEILEVGCGIGTDAIEFCKNEAKYTGTDVSNVSIEICQKRMNLFGYQPNLIQTNLHEYNSNWYEKFDLVYSFGVLHHDPNIKKIINNIYKYIKPNGEFKFMLYAKNSWKNTMIESQLDQFEAQSNCPWVQTYTKEGVLEILFPEDLPEESWKDVDMKQDHCFMYNVDEYKKGNYVLEPWFASMNEKMKNAIKKKLGWHLLVTVRK